MATSLTIPLDIIESVIQNLVDDPSTLRQCALVSRAFLSLSRKQFFRVVTLRSTRKKRHRPCRRLFQVLSAHGEIIPFIRSLVVEVYSSILSEETFPRLLHLIAHGKRLRGFSFKMYEALPWPQLLVTVRFALESLLASPQLSCVAISGILTRDFPVHFLASLPSLKHLSYTQSIPNTALFDQSQTAAWTSSPVITQETPGFPQLETLYLGHYGNCGLAQYLTHPSCAIRLSNLKVLSIRVTEEDLGAVVSVLTEAAAQSLESLIWDNKMNTLSHPRTPCHD
ncbi:hypothetical protein LshimejAT787_0200120 [Lyophyllum shimeji]|uniref:F-box domain-containing protein n=1 Tax=Lyophyllum shimeji TaxID=47721 RepID=A0A9P3PEH1_LYOSH|nr:hypothetical protein LshimejAT787_0200120 [Lyophyllum shimeji]